MRSPRLSLAFALLVTPDDRARTRRAIMHAALVLDRSGADRLSKGYRRRMLAGMGRAQRLWTAWGIAVFLVARRRGAMLFGFVIAVPVLIWKAVQFAVGG